MSLSVATWNINSVRLRINNVKRYLRLRQPDILCLQETKCPDDAFPHKAFAALGYEHRLVQGMKSYNGVARTWSSLRPRLEARQSLLR